jgi:hypothetical protein
MKKGKKVCWQVNQNGKKVVNSNALTGGARQPPHKKGPTFPIFDGGKEDEKEPGRFIYIS